MRTRLLIGLVLGLLALGGCVGADPNASYDRATTEDCLRDRGYNPKTVAGDDLARTGGPAADGVIAIESEGISIAIAFNTDHGHATERAEIVEQAADAYGALHTSNLIKTKGNVTYWTIGFQVPADEFADIDGCLYP